VAALAAGCVLGCQGQGGGGGEVGSPGLPGLPDPNKPGTNPDDPLPNPDATCKTAPACDASITVDPNGPALLSTDPEVLAQFPLEDVLSQILQFQGVATTPQTMMQRMFDTMNTEQGRKFDDVFHCDSPDNPGIAFKADDSFSCPRAEGVLASSTGFFKAGDPDSFIPVAVVNRFDLTPVDGSRCGQYRIVYAKASGLSDPNNRVFLILEAALSNPMPGCLESCRPVASFWKGLEGRTPTEIAHQLRSFFFEGLPGFKPVIHPLHYGFGVAAQGYGGTEPGQIRLSLHMEENWALRELHMDQSPKSGDPMFVLSTVKNNPTASLFDPSAAQNGVGDAFRQQFVFNELLSLSAKDLTGVRMFTSPEFNADESMLGGVKKNDYLTSATHAGDTTFVDSINEQIAAQQLGLACPAGDPLDGAAVIKRATTQSCAGCHAPKDFLGPSLGIGCGLTWPDSLGQSHINEKREISPALKQVFLPRRAEVLQTFLQACDPQAIQSDLQPIPPGGKFEGDANGGPPPNKDVSHDATAAVRTLGGSSTH
jgi:hypothetical protein